MIKPTIKLIPILELNYTLDYLEFIGHKGVYDLLWNYLVVDGFHNNGSIFKCYFPKEEDSYLNNEVRNALYILKTEFDIEKDFIWFRVAW